MTYIDPVQLRTDNPQGHNCSHTHRNIESKTHYVYATINKYNNKKQNIKVEKKDNLSSLVRQRQHREFGWVLDL